MSGAPGFVLLEDGTRLDGELHGHLERVTGEVVFNTSMTGYQESMTDPSYAGQIIIFTYPLIGNYGVSAAAMGVTGLETAFAALHTELVIPGVVDLGLLVERLAGGAEPFEIERPSLAPGAEANVVLCDLGAEWTVGEDGYESRSRNSWCAGRTLRGRVLVTVAAGQVAYRQRNFALGVAS